MVVRDVDAVQIGIKATDPDFWGVRLMMFTEHGPRETERFTGLRGVEFEGRVYEPGDYDELGLDDDHVYRALVDDGGDFVEIQRPADRAVDGASSAFDFTGAGF